MAISALFESLRDPNPQSRLAAHNQMVRESSMVCRTLFGAFFVLRFILDILGSPKSSHRHWSYPYSSSSSPSSSDSNLDCMRQEIRVVLLGGEARPELLSVEAGITASFMRGGGRRCSRPGRTRG